MEQVGRKKGRGLAMKEVGVGVGVRQPGSPIAFPLSFNTATKGEIGMNEVGLGTAIIEQIKNVLAAIDRDEAAIASRIEELESQGYRIVNYGQVSGFGWDEDDEPAKFECSDHRTGEIIWTGNEPHEDEQWPGDWYCLDSIHNEFDIVDPIKATSVPDWLAAAIQDMVSEQQDNEQKFRELLALCTPL
jgi:hypothetical protein